MNSGSFLAMYRIEASEDEHGRRNGPAFCLGLFITTLGPRLWVYCRKMHVHHVTMPWECISSSASSRRLSPGESECERRSPQTLTALHTRLSADELASTSAQLTKPCFEYSTDVIVSEHVWFAVLSFRRNQTLAAVDQAPPSASVSQSFISLLTSLARTCGTDSFESPSEAPSCESVLRPNLFPPATAPTTLPQLAGDWLRSNPEESGKMSCAEQKYSKSFCNLHSSPFVPFTYGKQWVEFFFNPGRGTLGTGTGKEAHGRQRAGHRALGCRGTERFRSDV